MSRRLNCTRCADTVTVTEIPRPFIDPERYVCGQCLKPANAPQIQLEPAEETRHYDPAIAEIPY